MDTKTLIKDTKARFAHNSAKALLKNKYASKLIIADQGGLWTASPQLISFVSAQMSYTIDNSLVIVDNFDNPVLVDGPKLLKTLQQVYNNVMFEWHSEWKETESKR